MFDFDRVIERRNTNSAKFDTVLQQFSKMFPQKVIGGFIALDLSYKIMRKPNHFG